MPSGRISERNGSNNNKDGDYEGVMQKWILRMEEAEKAEDASLAFLPKLQRCCTVLSSVSGGRFLDDERLVRIYIQLSSMSSDPIKVFMRAKKMRIGLRQSCFWCAWSKVVQDRGDWQTALSLLEEGRAYDCQPETLVNDMKAKLCQNKSLLPPSSILDPFTSEYRLGSTVGSLGYRHWESRATGSLLFRFPDEFLRVDILRLLGQGSYARVYACRLTSTGEEVAVKVERPVVGLGWECYIMLQMHRRLKSLRTLSRLDEGVNSEATQTTKRHRLKPLLRPRQVFQYSDGWVMPMQQGRNGTLHDLINMYMQKTGAAIPEVLAANYGAEMANALRSVHACDVLHCDIKSDNWLMMDDSENGGFGCARSVVLIDFGRSIDLQSGHSDCNTPLDSAAYLQHSRNGDAAAVTAAFNSNCCINKEFACIEMLEGRPWKHQVDLYGLACTLHIMLFGKDLKPRRYNSGGSIGSRYNTTGTSCVQESMSLLKDVEALFRQHICTTDRASQLEQCIKKQENMLYGM